MWQVVSVTPGSFNLNDHVEPLGRVGSRWLDMGLCGLDTVWPLGDPAQCRRLFPEQARIPRVRSRTNRGSPGAYF